MTCATCRPAQIVCTCGHESAGRPQRHVRVAAAVQLLTDRGWVEAGKTRTEGARVGTAASPILGGAGGELRSFGGRARFELPGTTRRVTVGPVTTCFYVVEGGSARGFVQVRTRDVDQIAQQAQQIAVAAEK